MFIILFSLFFSSKYIFRVGLNKMTHFEETTNDMQYLVNFMNNKTKNMYQNKMTHFEETTNDIQYLENLINNKTKNMYQNKMTHFEETTNDMQYLENLYKY